MARRVQTITELTDDLDGSEATETIAFAWRGNPYEIDLNEKNVGKFEKAIAPFVEHARKGAKSAPSAARRGGRASSANDTGAIRAWAREQGIQVSERGRISSDLLEQYRAAH